MSILELFNLVKTRGINIKIDYSKELGCFEIAVTNDNLTVKHYITDGHIELMTPDSVIDDMVKQIEKFSDGRGPLDLSMSWEDKK